MSDQFLAEIRLFPFNFAPLGWALCNGQTLQISQNAALFSLLGVNYGGDGVRTFMLPNLQGAVPLDQGTGNGLSGYVVGQTGGSPTVALTAAQNGIHSHLLTADDEVSTQPNANAGIYMEGHYTGTAAGKIAAYTAQPPDSNMSASAIAWIGSGQPHNNMMPYLVLNFCIAMTGIFPPRG